MPIDTELLSQVPLFRLLDEDERRTLAEHIEEVHLPAGHVLFRRGDPGDSIYIIRAGEVEISTADTTGKRLVLETEGPGDFFGELSFLDGEPRSTDAICRAETVALQVDRADLHELFRAHPDAAMDFLTVMGRRLREADRRLQYGPARDPNQEIEERTTLIQRVADFLAEFSGTIPFLLVHAAWFATWIAINTGQVAALESFDPFPFGLLTMVVSLEAIFLSCFVLISQNRQAAKDRIRTEVEYAANIKAGLEVSQLHVKVDRLHEEAMKRLAALERPRA